LLHLENQFITNPVYSPTGHILYHREPENPGLWALPFSAAKLEVTGQPFLVVPNADFPSVAADSTLAFVRRPDVETNLSSVGRPFGS
jgi:hypothetical protein